MKAHIGMLKESAVGIVGVLTNDEISLFTSGFGSTLSGIGCTIIFGDITQDLMAPIAAVISKRDKKSMSTMASFTMPCSSLTHAIVPPTPGILAVSVLHRYLRELIKLLALRKSATPTIILDTLGERNIALFSGLILTLLLGVFNHNKVIKNFNNYSSVKEDSLFKIMADHWITEALQVALIPLPVQLWAEASATSSRAAKVFLNSERS